MLDANVYARHARANIADWPTTIEHRGKEITVHSSATGGEELVLPGALQEDFTLTMVAIRADFLKLPEPYEVIRVKMQTGKWKRMEIRTVPDRYDTKVLTITFTVQPPAK